MTGGVATVVAGSTGCGWCSFFATALAFAELVVTIVLLFCCDALVVTVVVVVLLPSSERAGTGFGCDSSGSNDMGGESARIMSSGGGASGVVSDIDGTVDVVVVEDSMLLVAEVAVIGMGGGIRSMIFYKRVYPHSARKRANHSIRT